MIVAYEWVMSHIWMSHITYEWVMAHMNEVCHIWISRVTYQSGMSLMSGSCRTYEWGMSRTNESHIWMSHVTHKWGMSLMSESCRRYEWVMSHTNEACHTRMSHVTPMWMWHVTHANESCHTCQWVMAHLWARHVPRAEDRDIGLQIITTTIVGKFGSRNSFKSNVCIKSNVHIGLQNTTAKFSNNSWRESHNCQTNFYGNPKDFKKGFTGVNGSPRHSNE